LKPRQILTEGAFRNAIATVLAVSGSINAIKHLQATAVEAHTNVDIFALWDELSRKVPILTAVRPNGPVRIEGFEDAGGARAVLKQLESLIDTSVMTCTGRTLAQELAGYRVPDPEIIRPIDRPIAPGPAIVILKGSLAPESAVLKMGIPDGKRPESFEGKARVYDDTAVAMREIRDGTVRAGDVMILRGQGLKGGPAMGGGASLILFAIDAAGLAQDVAIVTDGQLSGLCLKGLTVAEVAPEAAVGGPIGLVRTGDPIRISVPKRSLDLLVSAEELAARRATLPAGYAVPAEGYLGIYRRDVQAMSTGAVLIEPCS
jgi:dihydroxy-acid dehydratase